MKTNEFEVCQGNPCIVALAMMEEGAEFSVVDMPKCEQKWHYNADGEYVRSD